MNIQLIWAQDKNGGIGKGGKLPWHIAEDLKNFKKITLNSAIIMGRKTWDSLPFKPLPNRRNIILSSKERIDVEAYNDINKCLDILQSDSIENLFVIGGQSVYKSFYSKASILHVTIVNIKTDGIDTFFPVSMNQIQEDFNQIEKKVLNEDTTYYKWRIK